MDKDNLISLVEQKFSTRQIGKFLNMSQTTVRHYLKKYNLKTFKKTIVNIIKQCSYCDKDISCKNNRKRKYCDNVCQNKWIFENVLVPKFNNGEPIDIIVQRKILSKMKGYICVECGNTGFWNNKVLILQIDHIDGNRKNNLPSNLRFLCPNCHNQTDTWGNKKREEQMVP